jgi:hypothetical protein
MVHGVEEIREDQEGTSHRLGTEGDTIPTEAHRQNLILVRDTSEEFNSIPIFTFSLKKISTLKEIFRFITS